MSDSSDDLEKRLEKRAGEAIKKLLHHKAGRRDLTLSEMEDMVGEFELEIRQSMMQELVAEAEETKPLLCKTCGNSLRYKGRKSKQVVTLRGEV